MAIGKYNAALLLFGRLRSIENTDVQAQFQYVACLKALGRNERARDKLLAMAQARPNDAKVFRELGLLYRTGLHNEVLARQYLMESLRLNPNQMDLSEMLREPVRPGPPGIPGLPPLPGTSGSLPPLPGLPR